MFLLMAGFATDTRCVFVSLRIDVFPVHAFSFSVWFSMYVTGAEQISLLIIAA